MMGFTQHVVLPLSTEKKVFCTLLAQDDTIIIQSSQHVVVVTAKGLKLLRHNHLCVGTNQKSGSIADFHSVRVRVGVSGSNSRDENTGNM
jgi:hypothetical protein